MAYRSARGGARRSGSSRTGARRGSGYRRSGGAGARRPSPRRKSGGERTIRIVVEQAAGSAIARPEAAGLVAKRKGKAAL